MKTPEIRIYYSWLLHDNVSRHLDKQLGDGTWKMEEDFDTLTQYAANYQAAWNPVGATILGSITKVLGIQFYQQVIDVPCAHWFRNQSEPLMMNFYYQPDQFVDQLTHELCHVLLTDNHLFSTKTTNAVNLLERWQRLFGTEHSTVTLVHIPVHALCKYVYLDVLKQPERLKRDIEDVKNYEDYATSWKYVNQHDYKQIIASLKQDYQHIATTLSS